MECNNTIRLCQHSTRPSSAQLAPSVNQYTVVYPHHHHHSRANLHAAYRVVLAVLRLASWSFGALSALTREYKTSLLSAVELTGAVVECLEIAHLAPVSLAAPPNPFRG